MTDKPKIRFFELISPNTSFDFVGSQRLWIRVALVMVILSVVSLPLNLPLPGRGRVLNWGVDFRGGSEVVLELAKPVSPAEVRAGLEGAGYEGVEVVALLDEVKTGAPTRFQLRFGSISTLSKQAAAALKSTLETDAGGALRSFDWSQGGDRIYLRFSKAMETTEIAAMFRKAGVEPALVQSTSARGATADESFEVFLVSLDKDITRHLDKRLGAGAVKSVPSIESVGAKAGSQLRNDAIKALLGAMLLIMLYVAFRFDVRYAPATVLALLHDSAIMLGVFAATFREVSLTTVAALLTIVGFSVNDKIVVFDRIREISARAQGAEFRRAVNQALNQTLSRTIITNSTVFLVTLAMNVFAVGVIREFAFAMNVGVVVSTFSSIFIATPAVIWLNDRFLASQKAGGRPPRGRAGSMEQTAEP